MIIEVDGAQHSQQTTLDQYRDKWFEKHGFKVLRFWNNEILKDTEDVLKIILQELEKGNRTGAND